MAARRLVIIMIILLIVSSIAAALAPAPQDAGEETTTTPTPPAALQPSGLSGELVQARVKAGGEPKRIRVDAGDQLQLTVRWDEVATLEITELGESDDVGPGSPAEFDVLLNDAGRYDVVPLERPNRKLATIIVRDPAEAPSPAEENPRSRGAKSAGDDGS